MGKLDASFAKNLESYVDQYFNMRVEEAVEKALAGASKYRVDRGVDTVSEREYEDGRHGIWTRLKRITGHIIQVYRGPVMVSGNWRVVNTGTDLFIENGEHTSLHPDDKIMWIVW